ncbi:hypothetical protein C0991_009690 [Blastosporella zonata]|nr:hypothetical protein C0991_009690 [Blastosporella zonata]
MEVFSVVLSILVIFALRFFLSINRRSIPQCAGNPIIHQTLSRLLHLLSPPNGNNLDLLASRAIPNLRLIKAFALTNTFVSPDMVVHTVFVGRATSLLKAAAERGWTHFQSIAIDAIHHALPTVGEVKFDVFVQDVTMRVALVALLDIDVPVGELNSEDIRAVTTLITLLWSLSKKPDPIPADLLPRLNHHLRRLIPDEEAYPNPLDFVIPVWETLWRVVATCVAYAHSCPRSKGVFSNLHNSPTITQFRSANDIQPSAEWFVTEVIRLHPPSKRIARAHIVRPFVGFLPLADGLVTKLFRPRIQHEFADIASVLKSTSIWGPDAELFEPIRFHSDRVTQEQEKIKLLPFGYGRYKCVAATWAPMAAGIVCSAILDHLPSERSNYRLIQGESIGGRDGWGGWSVIKMAD